MHLHILSIETIHFSRSFSISKSALLLSKQNYVLGFIKIKQILSLQCVFSILIASTAVLAFCPYSPRKIKKLIKTSAKKQSRNWGKNVMKDCFLSNQST